MLLRSIDMRPSSPLWVVAEGNGNRIHDLFHEPLGTFDREVGGGVKEDSVGKHRCSGLLHVGRGEITPA